MIIKSTLIFSLLSLLCFSCKTYEANELPDKQLYFGTGGGYAGSYDEFILLKNGQIFQQKGIKGAIESYGKVKRSQAKVLYQLWDTNKMGEAEFNHPGNLYYFVGMRTADGKNQLSWGDANHKPEEDWKVLHKALMDLTKDGEANAKK